jgi:transposase-like protein
MFKRIGSEFKTMNCPKCDSSKISKSGTRRGKPAFICRDCNYQFVENALQVGKPKLELCPLCPYCGNESRKLGKDRKNRQRYQCINCSSSESNACRVFTLES